jgi:excisionase family DNA binding protein
MNARRERRPSSRREEHLTVAEACAELGIARSTFYDWRAKGRAPHCFKLPNGELRIRRSDYETWLSSLDEEAA